MKSNLLQVRHISGPSKVGVLELGEVGRCGICEGGGQPRCGFSSGAGSDNQKLRNIVGWLSGHLGGAASRAVGP